MSRVKTFDCVQLKDAIQAQMRKEFQGLSDVQIRDRICSELRISDSVAARKWREAIRATSRKATDTQETHST